MLGSKLFDEPGATEDASDGLVEWLVLGDYGSGGKDRRVGADGALGAQLFDEHVAAEDTSYELLAELVVGADGMDGNDLKLAVDDVLGAELYGSLMQLKMQVMDLWQD